MNTTYLTIIVLTYEGGPWENPFLGKVCTYADNWIESWFFGIRARPYFYMTRPTSEIVSDESL